MRETEDRLRGVSETHSNIDPGHGGPWPETGDHTHCVQTSISDIQDTDIRPQCGKMSVNRHNFDSSLVGGS